MTRFIIGTAGHIDHGKSALVRALTGTDPDRLPEEKKRGITIDLGFAFLGEIAAIIDVPGHERLIRNMVAGAATIDFALLVVAADDGIMPQTTEHLQILRLLGIRYGAIVITKCDLVDNAWCDLIEEQIQTAVSATFLQDAPIFRVDSVSGRGIPALLQSLIGMLNTLSPREDRGVFRLPIDRVFSMTGRGTVVTGTVLAGSVQKNMRLTTMPRSYAYRVKRVESNGREIDQAITGQRAALNIIGETEKLERGQTLTIPHGLTASSRLLVAIELLGKTSLLKNRQRIRFLIGTQEVIGRVRILNNAENRPFLYSHMMLENEVTAVWGDRFIIRRYSPLETLGGGKVLDPSVKKTRSADTDRELEIARALNVNKIDKALCSYVLYAAPFGITVELIAAKYGIKAQTVLEYCQAQSASADIMVIGAYLLSNARFKYFCDSIGSTIRTLHDKAPDCKGFSRAEIVSGDLASFPAAIFDYAMQELLNQDILIQDGALYHEPQRRITVNPIQAELMDRVQCMLRDKGFMPPSAAIIAEALQRPLVDIEKTMVLLERTGRVRRLSVNLFFDTQTFDNAAMSVRRFLENHHEITVTETVELLKSSRKYAVPFLEYLDSQNITIRDGNRRIRGSCA